MKTLIGDVPDHWTRTQLHQVAEVKAGPSGAHFRAESGSTMGIPLVLPKDIRDGWIAEDGLHRVTPDRASLLAHYELEPGDIVCTRAGQLGRHALVAPAQRGWLFATGLLRVRPGGEVLPKYLTQYFALPEVRGWIKRHATGTAVPTITVRVLGNLPVVLPPLSRQDAIGGVLETLDAQVRVHEQISWAAASLREALAPLLITGTLPPPDSAHPRYPYITPR